MKIVAGLSKSSLKSRALEQSIKTMNAPQPIATWMDWFDGQPCDQFGATDKKRCEGCKDKAHCAGQEFAVNLNAGPTDRDMFDFARTAVEKLEALIVDHIKSLNPAATIHPDLQLKINGFKSELLDSKEALCE